MSMLRVIIIMMPVLVTPVFQRSREDHRDEPEQDGRNEVERHRWGA